MQMNKDAELDTYYFNLTGKNNFSIFSLNHSRSNIYFHECNQQERTITT
jgi:hypothetical protein